MISQLDISHHFAFCAKCPLEGRTSSEKLSYKQVFPSGVGFRRGGLQSGHVLGTDDAGGAIANTVTADFAETTPKSDGVTVPISQQPFFTVDKTTTTTSATAAGQLIPYTITLHNTGNVSLTSPIVSAAPANPRRPIAVTHRGENTTPPTLAPLLMA